MPRSDVQHTNLKDLDEDGEPKVTRRSFTAAEKAVVTRDASTAVAQRRKSINEIQRLEEFETPRRLAEAILTSEGRAWLQDNRASIEVHREIIRNL